MSRRSSSWGRGARALLVATGVAALPAAASPQLEQDANPFAAVGVPYLYNAAGTVHATGTPPLTFGTCGGPVGFHVDAVTGAVHWTPAAAGRVDVCVRVQDAEGEQRYGFSINVAEQAPPPPTVSATAWPPVGPVPLAVVLEAEWTLSSVELPVLQASWEAGDGSPAEHEPLVLHEYAVPGGYVARVRVRDVYGGTAEAAVSVQVKDAEGRVPPSARIRASTLRGRDMLPVELSCECAPGSSPIVAYRWELGEGTVSGAASVSTTYWPGRYHARLTVVDENGLAAFDEVEVVVSQGEREPPECRLEAGTGGGPATVEARWTAHAASPSGSVAQLEWWLDGVDAPTGRTASAQYTEPGWYQGLLKVVDDAGLTCKDSTSVAVLGAGHALPPRIVSAPSQQARCGADYAYGPDGARPLALGAGPMTWSLKEGPAGVEVDADGTVHWLPTPSQRGTQQVVLEARGAAGADHQHFTVEVSCPDTLDFRTGGCGATGGALAAPALLLLAAALRRRRAPPPGGDGG